MNIITDDIKLILRHRIITSSDIELLLQLLKRNCRRIYRQALKDKTLVRSDICQMRCMRKAVHGHHKSYLEPLNVTWLCELHHRQLHSKHIVDNFNLISSLVGSQRAKQIYKLMLPTNQTSLERIKKVTTITGSVKGDKVLWKARIKHCSKACLKIWEFANRRLFAVSTENIEQIVEVALGPYPEKETFVTRATVRAGIQERMKDAGWIPEEISC